MAKKKPAKKLAAKKAISKKPTPKKVALRHTNTLGIMPLGERIVVKPLLESEMHSTTSFGIIIPDTAKEKPEQGTVMAVGQGKRTDAGERIAPEVKVGDKVMFSKYGFDEVKVNGVEYYIVSEANILAILK